jgi:small-conductance mechanosensitive channel
LERSLSVTGKVLEYYLNDNWGGRITAVLLTIFFFFWVYINLKKIKQNNIAILEKLKYIHTFPILASLVFLFTITPFLDLHPPAVLVEMMQLLLVTSLTFLLFRRWPKKLFNFWLILFALLLFHSVKGLMVSSTHSSRIITFIIDILSIGLGVVLIREIKENKDYFPRYMVVVAILYILLNALAVLCNFFGRVTLAQVFGNTAISNLVQAIGLIVFIQIFIEAVYLQLEADKKSTRFTAYLNYQNVELRLRRILTFIAGIFWFINLTQNLNVYEAAYNDIVDFLNTVRTVGKTSFTLGSIAIFFFIIWIAHLLQKYIGYFFGDTEDEIMPDKKTKLGTSVLLVRLVILTAGFFLGILASGIPLDRVTIIIGALGVGIGLGLQNIVNNLVSGVILAIERPIQVGDLIEIGSNSGRVKEIGIRSSRIVTPDGAEVIIPNGDMLSQKLTNWTLSNSYLRGEIILKLANGTDIDKARKLVSELIAANEEIMQKPEPQVLVHSVGQSGTELQVLFWAFDINKWVQLKSDMLQKISLAFAKESIIIV